jgi:hypothetical protein
LLSPGTLIRNNTVLVERAPGSTWTEVAEAIGHGVQCGSAVDDVNHYTTFTDREPSLVGGVGAALSAPYLDGRPGRRASGGEDDGADGIKQSMVLQGDLGRLVDGLVDGLGDQVVQGPL